MANYKRQSRRYDTVWKRSRKFHQEAYREDHHFQNGSGDSRSTQSRFAEKENMERVQSTIASEGKKSRPKHSKENRRPLGRKLHISEERNRGRHQAVEGSPTLMMGGIHIVICTTLPNATHRPSKSQSKSTNKLSIRVAEIKKRERPLTDIKAQSHLYGFTPARQKERFPSIFIGSAIRRNGKIA